MLVPSEEQAVVCAKQVVVPTGGGTSFIRKSPERDDPWASKCHDAPLVKSYGQFLRDVWGAGPTGVREKERVVICVRDPSDVHPAPYRRHMDNTDDLKKEIMKEKQRAFRSHLAMLVEALQEGDSREVVLVSPEKLSM